MTTTPVTTTFAQLTTMRVGGPAERLEVADSTAAVVEAVREADVAGRPLLVLGGGSNLIVGDEGWAGTVVKIATTAVDLDGERVRAEAGVDWDHLVRLTVERGLAGLEALSGVPGSVGGTPVQNVGAYGALTSDVLESVTVYDRETGQVETWGADRCGFGPHRQSIFKRHNRWVILDVLFRLRRGEQSSPLKYAELAQSLGVETGGTAPAADVRTAVLALRRSKKMVLDPDDHDTWSVGSFFLNPIVTEVPAAAGECPQYDDVNGTKLSAAWLINHAGFPRGYGADWGNGTVTLSTRHALAVTNRGGATTGDVMAFAAHIRDGVEAAFGVPLTPECDLVNCALPPSR